jgi:oligosaccharide repeat unit polymerase
MQKKYTIIKFFVYNIIILFLYIYHFFNISTEVSDSSIRILGLIFIMILVVTVIDWGISTKSYFNPFTIFLVVFVLFTSGQVVLFTLGIREYSVFNIFYYFEIRQIKVALIYTMICYISFFNGALLSNIIKRKRKIYSVSESKGVLGAINTLGWILFTVFIGPYIYTQLTIFSRASTVGYGVMQQSSSFIEKLLNMGATYFICSIILLLIAFSRKKKYYDLISIIIYIHSILLLMVGERTEPVSLIVFTIWLRSYFFGKNTKKGIIGLLIVSLLMFLIFPSIMELRHGGIIQVSDLISNSSENGISDNIIESVAGLGYSMFPLIKTMDLVPSYEPFRYGSSYLGAFTAIVPFIGIAEKTSELGRWLMNVLEMSYGPGFSIPAEAYMNFGWFPLPIMAIFGFFIATVLGKSFEKKEDYISILFGSLFFIMNITIPRREVLGIIRDVFYFILPIIFMIKILNNKQINHKRRG